MRATILRRILLALAAVLALAAPAGAFEIDDMSPAERDAFRAEVRAYLLEHPEVLTEAFRTLKERRAARRAETDAEQIARNADALFHDGHSWVGGTPDGALTLVEFMDYQCAYCRRAAPEVAELVAGADDVRFVLKEFPILGPGSERAARFAVATLQTQGDAAYKRLHDRLIAARGQLTDARLRRIGDELDLDTDAITARMQSDAVSDVIRENRALARRLGIGGTPTFLLGDRMLRGYVPLDAMRDVLDEIRAEAG